MREYEEFPRPRGFRATPALVIGLLAILFLSAKSIAGVVIEFEWWKELGQLPAWFSLLSYGFAPVAGAAAVAFAALWIAHARGLKHAGTGLRRHPGYARIATLVVLGIGTLLAMATVDSWTVVRFAGSRGLPAGSYQDPVFGQPLGFYFFDLPFYRILLRFLLGLSLLSALVFWLTSRFWELRSMMSGEESPGVLALTPETLLSGIFGSAFVRTAAAVFLLLLVGGFYLDRYDLLFEDHGSLVGIDWTAENLVLPLIWLKILASVAAAAAIALHRARWALILPAVLLLAGFAPPLVHALYVRPSEITIQRPYIERHIQATRAAYGLSGNVKELEFKARQDVALDPAKHQQLLDNVRLWDWQAFHDTVTQLQALRPYYVFNDSDVDRYVIDGQLRQVLLTPRELDVRALSADARSRWINPHFIYTHGYGLVMAEAARITPEGYPRLIIQDAPPLVRTGSLKITRPEIYYGESTHDPVFVKTQQPEFDYPAGAQNVETRYQGQGGFPIASIFLRLAAAVSEGDWNILLTKYLDGQSRMMIRRNVRERLGHLAGFVDWDDDPYLVVTEAGRLVWVVDGYTASAAHPYARLLSVGEIGRLNYLRNSVKATVDAFDGTVQLFVFDSADPVLASYRALFPGLFRQASEMPADLRTHLRYPERIFRVQAEIYRTYHMTDPEAFFNKEDLWDIARSLKTAGGRPENVAPSYMIASLPDSDEAEFLLMTTFTPRGKDNLIGIMIARCDGEKLGQLVFLQLSKQALIYGPLQVQAQINQDQLISKDLSLWNQQGSEVLRGHMLVLPVENTLLYIEPIYLQSSSARMPQLKKVVVSSANQLIYADSYEQALARMRGDAFAARREAPAVPGSSAPPDTMRTGPATGEIEQLRNLFRRYRERVSQGKYAEAGKEMEEIERILLEKK